MVGNPEGEILIFNIKVIFRKKTDQSQNKRNHPAFGRPLNFLRCAEKIPHKGHTESLDVCGQ